MLGYDDYDFLSSKEWRDAIAKKNKDTIKRGQEILGFTGNDVDGIAGENTRNAYNTQMLEADQYYAPTKKAQYIPNENANQLYQDFNDAQVYGFNQNEAVNELNQEIYNEQVAKLQSQIAQVEERIARNKRALTGKSYEDVNNKLAQLEMDKIGFRFNGQSKNNDPTSFWRWNQARQDTKEANDLRKNEAIKKFDNEISKWENREFDPNMNAMEVRQEIKNLENAIQEGKNIGADVSRLEKVRQSLLGRISGKGTTSAEDKTGEFETFLVEVQNGLHTSEEIDKYAEEHKDDLTYAQYNKLHDAAIKAGKKEDDKAKANLEKKAKALFKKDRPHEDWNEVSETTRQKYRNLARGK